MPQIDNSLAVLRRTRGFSAAALAKAVGTSRQTIYAIEAGNFVPNTALALRLSKALETTVEELFRLAEGAPDTPPLEGTLLPGSGTLQPGQPVQLCRVNQRLVATEASPLPWYLPATDAVVSGTSASKSAKAKLQVLHPGDFRNRLLVVGCDPGISVLARHVQSPEIELVLAHRNSSQGLALLKQGAIHIAGTHLRDEKSGESNLPEIARMFPKNSVAVIAFASWEEGIVTQAGNPKSIRGIEDFGRKDVRIVNREIGAGSRKLLDSRLQQLDIPSSAVTGYGQMAAGHLHGAWQVQTGAADCCIATRAAARIFGLGFIPLTSERYDLVLRRQHLQLPTVQALFDTLSRLKFRRELEGIGGYDIKAAGQRML